MGYSIGEKVPVEIGVTMPVELDDASFPSGTTAIDPDIDALIGWAGAGAEASESTALEQMAAKEAGR